MANLVAGVCLLLSVHVNADCPSGEGYAEDGTTCIDCVPGTFSLIDEDKCTQCPMGKYSGVAKAPDFNSCIICPVGEWTSTLGSTAVTACETCEGKFICAVGSNANVFFTIEFLNHAGLTMTQFQALQASLASLVADAVGVDASKVASTAEVEPGKVSMAHGSSTNQTLVSCLVDMNGISTIQQVNAAVSIEAFQTLVIDTIKDTVAEGQSARIPGKDLVFADANVQPDTEVGAVAPPVGGIASSAGSDAKESGWPWWATLVIIVSVLILIGLVIAGVIFGTHEKKIKKVRSAKKPTPQRMEEVPLVQPAFAYPHEYAVSYGPAHGNQMLPMAQPMQVMTLTSPPPNHMDIYHDGNGMNDVSAVTYSAPTASHMVPVYQPTSIAGGSMYGPGSMYGQEQPVYQPTSIAGGSMYGPGSMYGQAPMEPVAGGYMA